MPTPRSTGTAGPAAAAGRRRGWLLALAMIVPVPVQLALQRLLSLLPEQQAQAGGYAAAALAALLMCALAIRCETARASQARNPRA